MSETVAGLGNDRTERLGRRRRSGRAFVAGGAVFAGLIAAELFDGTVGASAVLRIADVLLVVTMLLRPEITVPALVAGFLSRLVAASIDGAAATAPADAAVHTAIAAVTVLVLRPIGLSGRRLPPAREFIEALVVVVLAAPLAAAAFATALAPTPVAGFVDLERLAAWPRGLLGAAAITPIALLAGRGRGPSAADVARFTVAAIAVVTIAWVAERWFPYPFVVACVPLLVAATRVPPVGTAVLGAVCMVEMTLVAVHMPGGRGAVPIGAVVLAAALTGSLPVVLCLILAELREERQRLSASSERIRQILVGVAGHGFCSLDRAGNVTGWSDKIAALTGFGEAEVIGRSFAVVLPAEEREKGVAERLLETAARTGRAERVGWHLRGDGSRFWAQSRLEASFDERGVVVGFVKTVQDQSELQRSQTALMAAERRWGFALGSAGQGVWEHDLVAGRMHYSEVYLKMLGVTADELGEDPDAWKTRIHPDDAGRIPPDATSDDEVEETEFRLRRGDGRWMWVLDRRRVAERDDDGRPTRIIGIHTDITARRLAEEKFRLAVEASPNGLLIADREGRITLANRETERMFGYEPGTLLGVSIDELVPEAHRGDHAHRRADFAAAPTARRMGAGRDLNGRRRDGSLVPVEVGLNPIVTTEGAHVLCVVTDITARKRSEAELAFSEARYRMMADHFTDLVVHLDLDLNRTWVSPASRDILGLPPEALIGVSPSTIIHPEDVAEVARALKAVASGVDRATYCVRYRHADGHWIWLAVSLRLIRAADDGRPTGILAVGRDVTRARAAEEALTASEETFRSAMESASIGMALEDLSGRWVSVNRALGDILGYEVADLGNFDALALADPADVASDLEQQRRLIAGEIASYQIEKRWRHRSGRMVWTQQSVSLAKAPDGSPRLFILQIQDITERKQIEQMKSEFVSMVSHELRTPLTSIRGALGLVLGAMSEALPPRVVQLVDIAHKNSERLIPLVNDILDLDKIDAGMLRIDIVECDAVQLVRQAAEATRSFAERFGVTLVTRMPKEPMPLLVDEGRFIQVLTNLVGNAAKFSPRDGSVEIDLARQGESLRISVTDHGPGIPEAFRPRIFGRFAQADSATTRSKGGSGLGLHISRQLVDLMGGRIGFDSAVGVGSTFWVEFPLAAHDVVTAGGTGAPAPAPVAIASASGEAADFLAEAVRRAGLAPREVTAPEAAAESVVGAVAVLVEAGLATSDAGADLRRAIGGVVPPPAIVLVADDPSALPDGTAATWNAAAVWRLDPAHPADLVDRIAGLAAGRPSGLPRVLHVEDDVDLAEVIAGALRGRAEVVRTTRIATALPIIDGERFDLVLLDPDLPDGDGLAVLAPHIARLGTPVIVLSAGETAGRAEAAVAHLVKSRISEPQLVETIVSLLAEHRPRREEEIRHVG